MSGPAGFEDENGIGVPSPHLPAISAGRNLNDDGIAEFYYTLPDCVIQSSQDISLGDFQTTGDAVIVVPDQSANAANLSYFIATNHQRFNAFERNWPGTGLLVTHVDRPAGFNNRLHKRYDIEHPMGLYNWIQPVPGRNNLGVWNNDPNPISGLDSMDYRFTVSGTDTVQTYPNGGGGSGCFWQAGMEFTPFTNPNTNMYSGNSQSVPSDLSITNARFDSLSRVFTLDAHTDRWSGTFSNDAEWFDTVFVNSNVTFQSTAELTIQPGTLVLVDAGATISVEGTLTAVGTSADPIVFRSKDIGEKWNGIKVGSTASIEMEYVDMWNFRSYGINTDAPAGPVSIDHVNLNCADLKLGGSGLMLMNSPTVTQTVTNTHVYSVAADSQATGLYLYNCKVDFDSVTIEDCDHINAQIKKVTGNFHACTFKDRTKSYGIYFNTTPNTPNFRCCEFTNLAPLTDTTKATIVCASGTTPSFGAEGDTGGDGVSNTIKDSSAYLMVMEGTVSYPIIDSNPPQPPQYGSSDGGKNNWKQNRANGKFFKRNSMHMSQFPCTEQYWSPSFALNLFNPPLAAHWKYSPVHSTDWQTCGGGEGGGQGDRFDDGAQARNGSGMLDDVNYDSLYAEATVFENNEDYAAAQQLFRHIAENTSQAALRWNAITHVVACESFVLQGSTWVPELIGEMIELEDNYDTGVLGERLLASFYQNRAEYDQAIETSVALLSSGLTYEDSIQVAMDLVGIQLSMNGGGGRLDGAGTSMIPTTLRARNDEHALAIERELMGLLNPAMNAQTQTELPPREIKLHINYPNPFNATTVIEFELPMTSTGALRIYNIRGQLVSTLTDGTLNAGYHRVSFDAKGLASGLYFYRLEVGETAIAKKMLLLK